MITRRSRSSSSITEKASRLSNSPGSSVSLFSNWKANDLRLMHHYLTRTSESLVLISRRGAHRILQVEIPRIALEHEFVMHCVLGVASLHLHHLAPDVPEHQSLTIAHRVNALSGLRMAISQLSKRKLSGSSDELTYALSLVFRSLCPRDWRRPLDRKLAWSLSGFARHARVVSKTFLGQTGLAPIFTKDENPHPTLEFLPLPLSDMLSSMDHNHEDTKVILNTLCCLCRLYEHLFINGFTLDLTTLVIIWPANTDIWGFSALAKRRKPQTLIIAAYYLVFTKLLDEIWWMSDISSREIKTITIGLPTQYQSLMMMPLQTVHLHSKRDIASLLLSHISRGSSYEGDLERVSMPICDEELQLVEEAS